jgi:seryl-tRNA synthetase
MIEEMRVVKEELKEKEEALRETIKEWQNLMLLIPNIPDPTSPLGESEDDNVEIRTWGDKPNFSFEPKDHMEIMTRLGMLDIERGTKVHGFRGYFLTGEGVRLCFAIWNYALDFWSGRGFNPVIPPINTKREPLLGCAFIPQGEADIYKAQDDSYFVGTSEVPLMGMYMDEILDKSKLPIKMLGFSPCFRLEAGSHTKDIKGLIRVHEFYKFEQVVLCEGSHEESVKHHEDIQKNTEEFIQSLGIPYQVVDACTGDMGFAKVRMYDTNLWVPKEEKYREISSASYFHDFQTRRLGIRYRDGDRVRYTHSLNCTAIPTPRILVSLVENFQQADGSIKVPEVLQKYLGKDIIK